MDKISGIIGKDSMNKGKDAMNKGKDAFMKGISKLKTANPRDQSKFQFDIKLLNVDSLPSGTSSIYISWKRGSKSSNNGQTKPVTVNGKTANIQHQFSLVTTLQKEKPPKRTYEEKNISISIKEDKGKKASTLGKTVLNLADFTSTAKDGQFKMISIKNKKGPSLQLTLNITTKEMEIEDGEPMTETDMNSNDGSDDEEGEDFQDDDVSSHSDISSSSSMNNISSASKYSSSSSSNSTPTKSTLARQNSDVNVNTTPTFSGDMDPKHKAELSMLLGGTPSSSTSSKDNSPSYHNNSHTSDSTPTRSTSVFNKIGGNSNGSSTSTVSPSTNALANDSNMDPKHKAELNSLLSNTTSSHSNNSGSGNSGYSSSSSSSSGSSEEKRLKKEVEDQKKRIQELERQGSKGSSSSSSSSSKDVLNSTEYLELKQRFKEVASENVDMEDRIKELEEKLSSGGKSGSSSPMNTTSLPKDLKAIQDLQSQLKEKNNKISDLTERVDTLEHESYTQMRDNTNQTIALENKDREIEQLNREIQSLKESSGNMSMVGGGTLELKRRIQDLSNQVKDKDDLIKQLKSAPVPVPVPVSSGNNNSQIKQLESQVSELTKINHSQKQEIEKLKSEISSKSKSPIVQSSNSSELIDLKDRILSLQNENRELQQELEDSNSKIDQFKYRDQQLQARISELEDQNQQMENKMSLQVASASSLSFASGKISANNSGSSKLDKEKYEKQIETLQVDLQKERDRTKKLTRELTEQTNRVRDLENQLLSGNGSVSPGMNTVAKTDLQEREENRIIEQCIYTQSFSFREGVGATASSLYSRLQDQNTFSQENSRLFNKVVNGLTQSVEKSMYNSAELSYWLSNTSGLIHLIKDGPNNINDENDRDPLIDGILIDVNTNSPNSTSRRSPSLTFYYQLESLSRECYSLLLHNIYKKLKPKLQNILSNATSCILDKKTNRISSTMSHTQDIQKICKILSKYLNYFKDNYVFDSIVQQFFSQTFHFIGYTLLNEIIDGSAPHSCSPTSGFKIKLSISMIEDWISSCEERDLLSSAKEYLSVITEAANLMVIDKSIFTDAEAILSAFSNLNILQIKKLLEIWEPDQLSPDPIPSSVTQMARGNWNRPTNNLICQIDPTILIQITPNL